MRTLLGTALIGTALAAAVGCDQLPDPAFASLERALTVRVARVEPVGTNRTRFDLELTNRGGARASACLGPGRSVTGVTGIGLIWVDHPHCEREFDLDPDEALAWSETHEGTLPPERPRDVSVEVQILNPRRCSSGNGCAGFMIASAPLPMSK